LPSKRAQSLTKAVLVLDAFFYSHLNMHSS